jgi:hypothetical protein
MTEINKHDMTSMATTHRQTRYCSSYFLFKIVHQPFTLEINAPTIIATIL